MKVMNYNKGGIPRTMTAPECIASVIKEHNCTKIAEIGIHVCSFHDQLMGLLKDHPLEEYYMIDPWPYGYKCGSCGGENMTDEHWDKNHLAAVRRTIGNPILKVIRATSLAAVSLFENKSLDLVYIDADHTYDSVTEDIKAWLPKCRKVIGGHDYAGGWEPVVNAVDDFFLTKAGINKGEGSFKKFYQINDKHYRMDNGVWIVEL